MTKFTGLRCLECSIWLMFLSKTQGYYMTGLSPERAKQTALEIRIHWSVENKNHYKKNTCAWREDETPPIWGATPPRTSP